ncbi:ATP-dependent DNA helicase pif1-like [Metopolophium dirhodum]|uniref:ATP-dependent DNA helicase pif1-like n=1 Tax=Metopolophium dirhodum TaxID=44670 RepID=UPI002990010F|nr:ATP-dependent DNA helicase pif1-like [Metopolophium dirhodum]
MTSEQNNVFNHVINCVEESTGNIFFLDAPGGTGKTFIINLLLAKIRSSGKIAIGVASSGIASTLIHGGKTAHSMFKLPIDLNITNTPVCNIKKNSQLAKVLTDCVLIVWDECTMAHKSGVEALDRTLRDIRSSDKTMGGITLVFAGDFRQTLPVVPRGTRSDQINASLKSSTIWLKVNKLSLTVNMRTKLTGDIHAGEFSTLLLNISSGTVNDKDGYITIVKKLAVSTNSLEQLIQSVYQDIGNLKNLNSEWLCERVILITTNNRADTINSLIVSGFQALEMDYISIDTVIDSEESVHFPTEFLNSQTPSGMPPHKISLKVGVPIILLRNLNSPRLYNGTRLRVTSLTKNVIEAEILTGCAKGEKIFLPKIPLYPNDFPVKFRRVQFPIKVCFAMTINKAQGQTLTYCGVDLENNCFSHGQLYVAFSRVGRPDHLYVYAPQNKTLNVVYQEVLT